MRVGRVARRGVVQRRADRERDGVARVLDQVHDVAVVEARDVVVVHRQDAIAHVEPGTAFGRTVPDDLADERDALRHRRYDDESEAFVFSPDHRDVVRVDESVSIAHSRRITSIC